jgi:hypothetical protein
MTPENFCYWLQGIFEIQEADYDKDQKVSIHLTTAQVDMIRRHLSSVFSTKIELKQSTWTPDLGTHARLDGAIC